MTSPEASTLEAMCAEYTIMPTLASQSDKRRRKRTRLRHAVLALFTGKSLTSCDSPYFEPAKASNISVKRAIFILTTLAAFLFGLTVGILIPEYVLGTSVVEYSSSQMNSTSHIFPSLDPATVVRLARSKKDIVNSTSFQSVSFVNSTTHGDVERNSISPGWLDGVYWNQEVEKALPSGYSQKDATRWRKYVRTSSVVKMEEGCGRMQNRLLIFKDGTRACSRYRQNTDQIQGEIFSFFLGRILGLKNLTPSTLAVVKARSSLWSKVKSQASLAQWHEDRPVVVTMYLPALEPAYIPSPLRSVNKRLHPNDVDGPMPDIVELAQWSDLIVFDYLTANLDRVVNNMYNLQWNPGMMNASAHNLAKNADTGLLVFLDNESGLLHGYRLLSKYESYHSVLLDALCVFRKPTIDALTKLKTDGNVGYLLNELSFDELDREALPTLPEKSIRILNSRIERVLNHVAWCEKQYAGSLRK
ncbi:unnamed protein product [Bemisia tabaci]|uniref:Four-jointed n=1 Tax=Bemisia tabaci TaxID=7038 RepID=A0A9P0AHD5_BEMTA|nr:PREDICTED: extracellular serine/threonine protein kinase four-jointed [Bemisia tabaci]CAH0391869.1 unnamed protein product [Bemisia tabaci]